MAAAKHKFQRLLINPAKQKLIDFLEELENILKDAIVPVAAQAIIEQFIYASHQFIIHSYASLKTSINQAHIWTDWVTSWKRVGTEWFGSSRWAEDENCDATNHTTKPKKPKPTCHHCKKTRSLPKPVPSTQTREKPGPKTIRLVTAITITLMVVKQTLTIKFLTIPMQTIQTNKKTEKLDLSTHPVRPAVKLTIPQRNANLEQTQLTDRLPGTDGRKDNQVTYHYIIAKPFKKEAVDSNIDKARFLPFQLIKTPIERRQAMTFFWPQHLTKNLYRLRRWWNTLNP